MHNGCPQLKVVVALYPLLCQSNALLAVTAPLKLPRQQAAQPLLEERYHPVQEEDPHPPARGPEPNAWSFAYGSCVEPVVNEVLQVLAHPDLTHQPILVPVHASQLPDVGERVLQAIRQPIRIDVTHAELHVRIDDQLGQTQNLSDEMESVAEATLLPLFRRQGLGRLQVEVVVEMEIIQPLALDEQVQHVIALSAHLQTSLYPVQLSALKELRFLEFLEKAALARRLDRLLLESIQDPSL